MFTSNASESLDVVASVRINEFSMVKSALASFERGPSMLSKYCPYTPQASAGGLIQAS